jgi:hypothetical protein
MKYRDRKQKPNFLFEEKFPKKIKKIDTQDFFFKLFDFCMF